MSPAPPPYAELHCRSNYTFLVGASEPEELVERAAAKLYTAIALTDECSVSGVVRAHLAVRVGQPVSRGGYDLQPNGEAYLRGRAYLRQAFLDASMRETLEVARQCTFSLEELRYEYPEEIVPPGETPPLLSPQARVRGGREALPFEGPRQGPRPDRARARHHPAARVRGLLPDGRGHRALGARARHPVPGPGVRRQFGDLLLPLRDRGRPRAHERAVRALHQRRRKEPPDIDIDFEHQRREEVMQYIYRKYGRDRAALTGVVIAYRSKSAIRDVGKALGLELEVVDRLAKTAYGTAEQWVSDACLLENELDPTDRRVKQWLHLANEIRDFPRHLSQHPGGFVIARDKLSRLVPVENASMENRSVVQWDKNDLDALGLIKVDVLALGMLSAIHRALDLVAMKLDTPFGMQDVPPEDPATYDMICLADTVGVFQIESRAQMTMLPRMRPRCFYDLVIQVAIVRPGPIQGGMVHPYLRRRAGEEAVTYPSAEIRHATERTLGVPIFQEQVMQIAMLAADFTAGEADQLGRAMGAWRRRGGLEMHQRRLVERMLAKGYTAEFAGQIAKQVEGFSSYCFPKSHAASFALLVYVSYLKRHHPDAQLQSDPNLLHTQTRIRARITPMPLVYL